MKKNASRIFAFFAFACSFLTTCTEPFGKLDNPYDEKNGLFIEATSLRFASSTSEMYVGESRELSCRFNPSDATNTELVWTSTAESVVKIDQEGKATGLKIGKATITATNPFTKLSASVDITVTDGKVKSIELDIGSVNLGLNASRNLVATVLPLSAKDKSVSWTSSDSETVAVDNTGRVTGKRYGTATITAITTDGGKQASCVVTVVDPVPCTGIMLKGDDNNWAQQTIVVGENQTISVTYTPENTTETELIWTSDNASVATVDSKGVVTGKAQGDTYITAKLKERPEISNIINVSVIDPDYLQSISIVTGLENGATPELVIGEALQLSYATVPENAPCTVTWSSDNPEIATVDQTGLVTAKQAGNIYISVTATQTNSNSRFDSKYISVIASRPAQSVEIVIPEEMKAASDRIKTYYQYPSSSFYLFTGKNYQLSGIVSPENATNKTITWSSSDASIASIDQDGLLTINDTGKTGSCSISANIPKDLLMYMPSATINIEVLLDQVSGVSLSSYPKALSIGETYQLTANVSPSYATNQKVLWSSSDPAVLSVNDSGLIEAKSSGTATIEVITDQNNCTDPKPATITVDNFPFALQSSLTLSLTDRIAISATGDYLIMDENTAYPNLYYSTDKAKSWTKSNLPDSNMIQRLVLSPDGSLAAGAVVGGYIYTSSNHGADWTKRTASGTRNWTDVSIADDNQTIVACLDTGFIFFSKNSGETWARVPNSQSLAWRAVATAGNADSLTIVGATDSKVYVTHNGGTDWISSNISLSGYTPNKVVVSPDGLVIQIFAPYRIMRSIDGGTSWTTTDFPTSYNSVPAATRNGSFMLVNDQDNKIRLSVDSGETWSILDRSMTYSTIAVTDDLSFALIATNYGEGNHHLYTCDIAKTNGTSLGITIPSYNPPALSIQANSQIVQNNYLKHQVLCSQAYTSVTWYLDGMNIGTSPEMETYLSTQGAHILTVQVQVDGNYYSESLRIIVKEY